MIVVDASALAPAPADDGPDGDTARARLRGETLAAPALIDLETTAVIRRLSRAGLASRASAVSNASGPRCEIELRS